LGLKLGTLPHVGKAAGRAVSWCAAMAWGPPVNHWLDCKMELFNLFLFNDGALAVDAVAALLEMQD
jgi:hypothetical protein